MKGAVLQTVPLQTTVIIAEEKDKIKHIGNMQELTKRRCVKIKAGKILSTLLGVVIAVLQAQPVFAQDMKLESSSVPLKSGDWLYRDRGNFVSVCGYLGNREHITIPSEIEGKEVLEVSHYCGLTKYDNYYQNYSFFMEEALNKNQSTDTVLIGPGTGEEERQAYVIRENPATKRITLPDTVKKIGVSAFNNCKNLEQADLPQGLEVIEESAFEGCERLNITQLPKTLKTIRTCGFSGTGISGSLTLPESLAYIGEEAFSNCKITQLEIPQGVKYIRSFAFANCNNLKSVSFPEGMEIVIFLAFSGCMNLQEIHIPKSAKKITFCPFYKLKDIYFAADRETLEKSTGSNAFNDFIYACENNYGYANINFHFGERVELPVEKPVDNAEKKIFMITAIFFSLASLTELCLYIVIKVKSRPKDVKSERNALTDLNKVDTVICKKCGAEGGKNAAYCYNCGHKTKSRK